MLLNVVESCRGHVPCPGLCVHLPSIRREQRELRPMQPAHGKAKTALMGVGWKGGKVRRWFGLDLA